MSSIIHQLQQDDPSYDPIALACHQSGVGRSTFTRAFNRVVFDGYYGPVSAGEWRDAHDDCKDSDVDLSSVPDALEVLRQVSDGIQDYESAFFDLDQDDQEFEYTEVVAEASDIRREVFSPVIEIYGHLPF